MSQHLVSEAQVKKALKIDSFRNISRDKIMEFVSLMMILRMMTVKTMEMTNTRYK